MEISGAIQTEFSPLALQGHQEAAFWANDMGSDHRQFVQHVLHRHCQRHGEAGDAVKKFLGSTLAGIGQMITQTMIFNAITGIFKGVRASSINGMGDFTMNPMIPSMAVVGEPTG